MQRRTSLEPAQACHLVAGIVGRAWKAHRRHLPSDCKDLLAELLLGLRAHILTDPPSSRYDFRNVTSLLKDLATVPTVHDSVPLTQQPSLLTPVQPSPSPEKIVTFGATVIHEFIPLQCVGSDGVQDNEVTALKKGIGDLETQIQRMSDSHRSAVAGLKDNLKDVSQLLAQAHSQIESNSSALLDSFASFSASASMTLGLRDGQV